MAEIGKPIGRGPGLTTPQPASGSRRGAAAGRRGAAQQRLTDGHAPADPSDTLEGEHGQPQERAAPKPSAPRGYQAGLARPTGAGARPVLGSGRLPPRAAGTMPAVGPLSLQANKEHGPMVFAAALSHLNMLTGPAAQAAGVTAPQHQEALREMSRLLQQAHLQHGFTEADAAQFVSLAQATGLADQKKIMAAAQLVRPASPGTPLKDNPYATLDAIHEEHDAKAAPTAEQAAQHQEALKAQLAEQEVLARSHDSAARFERVEQKLAVHAQELQAATQEARMRARRLAGPDLPIGTKLAQERAQAQQQQASVRGHTVPEEALSPEEAKPKKSTPR